MKKILSIMLAVLLLASLPGAALAEGPVLTSPKTGDSSNILLWVILLAVSAIAVAVGIALYAKNKKKSR